MLISFYNPLHFALFKEKFWENYVSFFEDHTKRDSILEYFTKCQQNKHSKMPSVFVKDKSYVGKNVWAYDKVL